MRRPRPRSRPSGPLAEAVDRVGDRWSLLLVDALLRGPRRFSELHADVPGVSTNVLADRLKRLEADGLVVARPYRERPVRLSYELTAPGAELAGALHVLASWGARASGAEGPHRHDACGSPLEVRWWCPGCRVAVDPDDVDTEWV